MDTTPVFAPVSQSDRLINLDFVRGIALFGILMVNVAAQFGPIAGLDPNYYARFSAMDRTTALIVQAIFTTKFISIFSLLFGYGLFSQMEKAQERGRSAVGFTFRRLGALALFGLVHALAIWYGDVLFVYAMLGSWLLLARRARARTLIIVWVCLLLFGLLVMGGLQSLKLFVPQKAALPAPIEATDGDAPSIREMLQSGTLNATAWSRAEIKAYRDGPWLDAQIFRTLEWGINVLVSTFLFGWVILGMFFLGAALWRVRFFAPEQHELRWRVCRVCLPLGLLFEAVASYFLWSPPSTNRPMHVIGQVLHQANLFFLPMGYLTLFSLLSDRLPLWIRDPIASAGRMSLTVYLLESVIATGLAYHWGFRLFGTIGALTQRFVGVGIWVALVLFSFLWLRYFTQGPMEWLWRRMGYGATPARGTPTVAPTAITTGITTPGDSHAFTTDLDSTAGS